MYELALPYDLTIALDLMIQTILLNKDPKNIIDNLRMQSIQLVMMQRKRLIDN